MDLRQLKGLEIAARFKIDFDSGNWIVPSSSGNGKYGVVLEPAGDTCTCEDFGLRKQACKHIYASKIVRDRDHGGKNPPFEVKDDEQIPKRPTYKQTWPLFNLAQQTEKRRFQSLLFDLLRGVEEPPRKKLGRRPTSMRDMIFASAFKVFSTVSSRRFACDLQDAHERGYLSSLMNSITISRYLEDERMTPILTNLVIQSSLPLKTVETVFAPDSTGFSVSRHVRWYDEKWGAERSGRDWVKAHAICGVRTNIVTAIIIEGRDAADCPQFKPLVETTAKNFTVKEVPADKAYLSKENLELLAEMGGTALIPFKVNSVAGETGSLWEKMFHYYQFKRDEFLPRYHQRSNAESTFSMCKAKFGDAVRSKTDVAMKNEVLCKFLCHNIVVVHQSHLELGIEPVFWKDEAPLKAPDEQPAVLPFSQPG
jgi:transposase